MPKKSKFWFKNEKLVMKRLGMKGTPGSGNGWVKEDGQNEYLIAQLKSTERTSITFKLQDLNSLFYNAEVSHKLPVFINQFLNGPMLVTMRLEDIHEIASYLETGKKPERAFVVVEESEPSQKPIIQSGNRIKVRRQLEKEKQEGFKKRMKGR